MNILMRKLILACVSVAMLISGVHSQNHYVYAQNSKSKTDAEIIIDNYKLTSKESSILLHESINTKSYLYSAPTNQDGETLIQVDADNFVVYAADYKDTHGNTWVPKKVVVSENDKNKDYVINDNQTKFKAESDNYSIEVEYQLYVSIDKDTQLRLLNTPYWLASGIDTLDLLYGVSNDLKSVADLYMPILIRLKDGKDMPFNLSISDDKYVAAVSDLENQLKKNKNSTKYFDLNEEIKIYEDYSGYSDQEYYYSEHAQNLKTVSEQMKLNLESIAYCQGFDTIMKFASQMAEYKDLVNKIKTMVNYMKTLAGDMAYAMEKDNWAGMNYELLSDIEGDTGIVKLLTKRGTVNDHSNEKINTTLYVDSQTLKCTINRDRVNVIVQAYVIDGKDSNELTLLQAEPFEIALKHEMSASDVHENIKNKVIEKEILKQWQDKYQVCDDYYVYTTTDFGEKLVEDITYTITYTPKTYNVIYSDNGDKEMNVYYGYQLTLPKAGSGFSYDYTINDVKYRENDVLRITNHTTIDRIIGKEKVTDRLLNVLAKDSTYNFSDLAKAILTNEAVKSDMVEYRIVEEMDVNTVIDYDSVSGQYVLTVNSYPSGIDGMDWIPVSFSVVKGGKETGSKHSITDGKATFKTDYLDGVNVYYELKITKNENIRPISVTNSYLYNLINLPSQLLEESQQQIESLDYLASLAKPGGYLTMGSTIYSALGMIQSNYEEKYGKDTSLYPANIKVEYDALDELRSNCFNHSNKSHLYVYEYILKYMPKSMNSDASELGLIAYYSDEYGYEQYQKQLDLLVKHLNTVKNSEEFNNLLTGQLEPYKEKVEKLIDLLDNLELVKPSDMIDASHASAVRLFDLLDDKKSADSYEEASGLTDRTSISKPLEGKVSIIMSATVDGNKYTTTSLVYDVNHELTEQDINKIKDSFNDIYSQFNSKYYTKKESVSMPKVGQRITENLYLNETWDSTLYKVYIKDVDTGKKEFSQSVTYTDTVLTLDKPALGYRYDYTILDEVRSAETSPITYTITTENFDQLFETGEFVILRKSVDLTRERLSQMFNKLNEPFKDMSSGFVLSKGSNGYNAILRIDPSEKEEVQKILIQVISLMNETNYGYIALGDKNQALWNANKAELSAQSYVNALLQSGFKTDQIINVIDKDGDIKENVIDIIGKKQDVVVGIEDDLDVLGGYLYDSTLYLGTSSNDESYIQVKFIVSVEDFDKHADLLKEARENLMISKDNYHFNTENDKLNLVNTLSDETYSLIVSMMVYTGVIEFDDINDLTFEDMMSFFKQYEDMFKDENMTSDVILNTYRELGIDVDLSEKVKLIDAFLNLNRTHLYRDNHLVYDLSDIMNELSISDEIKVLFKESELNIPTDITLTNLDGEYEAVVFNPYSSHSVSLIKVLDDIVLKNKDNSIILLKDISHDISLSQVSSLDLNGYKVNGDIKSSDNLVILDSQNTGYVSGSLSKNIEVTGGSYKTNIESYIKEGYKIDNDRVVSKYFTVSEDDGKVTVEVNPDMFNECKDISSVILDIIVSLNDYTKAYVQLNEHEIYVNSYETLKDLMNNSYNDDLINHVLDELNVEDLYNELLNALYNYEAIVEGKELLSLTMNSNDYALELSLHNGIINGHIKMCQESTLKDIVVKMKNDQSYKNAMTVLKDIADVDYEDIKINDIQYDKTIIADLDNVKLNINVNNDVKYTLMLGVILAYGTQDEQLISAMRDYIANDTSRENLKLNLLNAIHDLTTKQFVDAIKHVSETNVSFSDMCKTLDFSDFNQAAGKENNLNEHLDEVLADYVDYITSKFDLYNITGDDQLLQTSYVVSDIDNYDEVNITLNLIAELPCTHKSSYEVVALEPGCSQEGIIEVRCEECNEVLSTKSIAPKGHGQCYIDGQKDPTCEEDGYSGDVICADCHEVVIAGEIIKANGHETSIHNVVEATCQHDGYTGDTICNVCHKLVSAGKVIEKLPHEFKHGVCSMCNYKDPHYKAYMLGDVSGDNKINALDYIKIKNHIMGTKRLSEEELERADVSGDNRISALDYIKIKNHIMGTKRIN